MNLLAEPIGREALPRELVDAALEGAQWIWYATDPQPTVPICKRGGFPERGIGSIQVALQKQLFTAS